MELDVLLFGKKGPLNAELLLSSVSRYLGIPYRYGGDSEAGIRLLRVQHEGSTGTRDRAAEEGAGTVPGGSEYAGQ